MALETVLIGVLTSTVLSVSVNKLADSALNQCKNIKDAKKNVDALLNEMNSVLRQVEMLGDGPNGHLATTDFSKLESLMQRLTALCYDVDDISDDINLEEKRGKSWSIWLDNIFSSIQLCRSSNGLAFNNIRPKMKDLPSRIKTLTSQFEEIFKELSTYGARPTDLVNTHNHTSSRGYSESSSVKIEHLTNGRLCEKKDIIQKLLKMRINDCGICIVGMAGLGKSVLAHSILDDPDIKKKFNVILSKWNSKTCKFDFEKLCMSPNTACTSASSTGSSSRTSLLLLDDFRISRGRDWMRLKNEWDEKLGPTLYIITTRDPEVAEHTKTTPHRLKNLSIEDCETIIKETVSIEDCKTIIKETVSIEDYKEKMTRTSPHSKLVFESKAKEIARNCSGLPLVAHVIGTHLKTAYHKKHSEEYKFVEVVSNIHQQFWKHRLFWHDILPELWFGEKGISNELYKSIAYFALFPSDHEFRKNEVSQLWMAEGTTVIPAINSFDSLVSASILQPRTSSSSTYHMHNFPHKFAEIIAWSTYFRLYEDNRSSFKGTSSDIRHFSFCLQKLGNDIVQEIIRNKNLHKLRTFLLLHKTLEIKVEKTTTLLSMFEKLVCLRVLSLKGSDIEELPHNISSLKHLRYIDVSHTYIKILPVSISKLVCLQVLKLKGCSSINSLSLNFESLTNLIHLDLDISKLCSFPKNLGKLTKLQTLPGFIVQKSMSGGISQLRNMNSLSGSLKITQLENIIKEDDAMTRHEAEEAKLCEKKDIKSLELTWSKRDICPRKAEIILTRLEPNQSLVELKISGYNGFAFPSWVTTLGYVCSIHLYNIRECVEFPSLGLLVLLKKLHIERMGKIEKVKRSARPPNKATPIQEFPALETLKICNMAGLRKWKKLNDGDMPHLRVLIVNDCPSLRSLHIIRHLPPSSKPQIENCPNLILENKLC